MSDTAQLPRPSKRNTPCARCRLRRIKCEASTLGSNICKACVANCVECSGPVVTCMGMRKQVEKDLTSNHGYFGMANDLPEGAVSKYLGQQANRPDTTQDALAHLIHTVQLLAQAVTRIQQCLAPSVPTTQSSNSHRAFDQANRSGIDTFLDAGPAFSFFEPNDQTFLACNGVVDGTRMPYPTRVKPDPPTDGLVPQPYGHTDGIPKNVFEQEGLVSTGAFQFSDWNSNV